MANTARTDLAAEAQRLWSQTEEDGRLPAGVSVREEELLGLPVQAVEIGNLLQRIQYETRAEV